MNLIFWAHVDLSGQGRGGRGMRLATPWIFRPANAARPANILASLKRVAVAVALRPELCCQSFHRSSIHLSHFRFANAFLGDTGDAIVWLINGNCHTAKRPLAGH
ncbi:hypothetical protein [Belnapia rosea]|uniref:hypothetical protein n=1 Tax=Belnapia rosea TaxID=938405 RepID=UPI00115FC8D5|nr:hypothetical protein [Belnapia rosea]